MASAMLFPRTQFRWIPCVFPVVVIACLVMRSRVASDAYFTAVGMPTHLRFDALFAGVTLSWFYHFRPEIFRKLRASWLPLATLLLIGWQFAFTMPLYVMHSFGYTATLLGFSMMLLWATNTQFLGKLKPLARIGKYSYS